MATGTSASTCVRNINRARFVVRNESRLEFSSWGSAQCVLPRHLQSRRIHTTTRSIPCVLTSPNLELLRVGDARHNFGLARHRRSTTSVRYATTATASDEAQDASGASVDASPSWVHIPADPPVAREQTESVRAQLSVVKMARMVKIIYQYDNLGRSNRCTVKWSIQGLNLLVEGTGETPRKTDARLQANLAVVSKLKERGLWTQLLAQIEKRRNVNIGINDDLLFVMHHARMNLLRAEQIARARRNGLTRRLSKKFFISPTNGHGEQAQLIKAMRRRQWNQSAEIKALPVNSRKKLVLDLINNHPYSIVVGETGSGKSTQIPQILLDDAIANGAGPKCKVLCVQPRRIAACSLAQRVAEERLEKVGQTVGYQVRTDGKRPGRKITYCTTGVMLLMLQESPSTLQEFTHIILDEVHVRDVGIDFVMLLVKRFMSQLQPHGPKVVIMSATLDIDLFSSYFCNLGPNGTLVPAPHLSIPGRTFNVDHHYLNDILEGLTDFYAPDTLARFLQEDETASFLQSHYTHFGGTTPSVAAGHDTEAEGTKELSPPHPGGIDRYDDEDPLIPYGLFCATIFHILSSTTAGSILVFLPGILHIARLEQALHEFSGIGQVDLANEELFRVLKLHASLPEEQEKLSLPVPSGCRRILLSTDIAEASVTIPDVKYVLDSGKVHEMLHDSQARIQRMACAWVSQSSVAQRSGRAGRVQPGEYFAMFTKERFDSLRMTKTPEMVRVDLQPTCLRAKRTPENIPVADLLQQTIEPPDKQKVLDAVTSLRYLQALDENENLTDLGLVLRRLPMDPATAKLVILGIIFRCLDPLLILAAMGGELRLFHMSTNLETNKRATEERRFFAESSGSDHMSVLNAFRAVRYQFNMYGRQKAFEFCREHYIHFPKYQDTWVTARQILVDLVQARLISPSNLTPDDTHQFGHARLNTNAHNINLIKALVLHCVFPSLAAPPFLEHKGPRYVTETDDAVYIGGPSANHFKGPRTLLLFNTKQKALGGSKVLKNTSVVSPLAACLFGGRLRWDQEDFIMDSWLRLGLENEEVGDASNDHIARSVIELRKALDTALAAAFESLLIDPTQTPGPTNQEHPRDTVFWALADAVVDILSRDSFRPVGRGDSQPT